MAPELGQLNYEDNRSISMADLPGLVEGASRDRGLGHAFLRHIERTKLLCFVVDVNGYQDAQLGETRSASECVMLLNKELELYNIAYLRKPAILVVNKMDSKGCKELYQKFLFEIQNRDDIYKSAPKRIRPNILVRFENIVPVSAKYMKNTKQLKKIILDTIDHQFKEKQERFVAKAKRRLLASNRILEHFQ